MRMYFKQRLFSWFDSYDIYNEQGNPIYVVKGQISQNVDRQYFIFKDDTEKSGTGADREDQGAFECVFQCEGTACVQSAGVITYR